MLFYLGIFAICAIAAIIRKTKKMKRKREYLKYSITVIMYNIWNKV